jgi:hypothetical protein
MKKISIIVMIAFALTSCEALLDKLQPDFEGDGITNVELAKGSWGTVSGKTIKLAKLTGGAGTSKYVVFYDNSWYSVKAGGTAGEAEITSESSLVAATTGAAVLTVDTSIVGLENGKYDVYLVDPFKPTGVTTNIAIKKNTAVIDTTTPITKIDADATVRVACTYVPPGSIVVSGKLIVESTFGATVAAGKSITIADNGSIVLKGHASTPGKLTLTLHATTPAMLKGIARCSATVENSPATLGPATGVVGAVVGPGGDSVCAASGADAVFPNQTPSAAIEDTKINSKTTVKTTA